MPADRPIAATSAGVVSVATRITVSPAEAKSSAACEPTATMPEAAPGDAARPVVSRVASPASDAGSNVGWSTSISSSTRRSATACRCRSLSTGKSLDALITAPGRAGPCCPSCAVGIPKPSATALAGPHPAESCPQRPNRLPRWSTSEAIGTRSWPMVSRSRTVTQRSSMDSKSTVTHSGVPISSWRR